MLGVGNNRQSDVQICKTEKISSWSHDNRQHLIVHEACKVDVPQLKCQYYGFDLVMTF